MARLDWVAVLNEVELNTSRGAFMAWFKNTELVEVEGDEAVVLVINTFAKKQLESKMPKVLLDVVQQQNPDIKSIRYVISKKQVKRAVEAPVATAKQAVAPATKTSLNQKYTFVNFIVGSSNELAMAACQAVVDHPGTKYNPLFLWGGVGLGKTHLMQAVGNQIKTNDPSKKVLYINTEEFVNNYIQALRNNKGGISDLYRSADVLIVDDMQFIAGKEKTQEEFFHTFNALHQSNKQIIISSDTPPKAIPTLTERLRSRFEMGMTIDIQMPDFETRSAIITSKAQDAGLNLGSEVIEYIALSVRTNIRELEGNLNQVMAYCEMRGEQPTLELVKGLLEGKSRSPRRITTKHIIDATCSHFQIDEEEILSPKRDKSISLPRQIAMYLIRSELKLSYPKVARELGRKDHTTAMHSVDKITKSVALDQQLRSDVNTIKEALYA